MTGKGLSCFGLVFTACSVLGRLLASCIVAACESEFSRSLAHDGGSGGGGAGGGGGSLYDSEDSRSCGHVGMAVQPTDEKGTAVF